MGIKSLVKKILVKKENMRYEKRLADRRISYRQWLSENAVSVDEKADEKTADLGDFVVFTASEGTCPDGTWHMLADYFRENPETVLVYGDEDVRGEEWGCPWYKPDWSPDLFEERFYFGGLVAARKSWLVTAPPSKAGASRSMNS